MPITAVAFAIVLFISKPRFVMFITLLVTAFSFWAHVGIESSHRKFSGEVRGCAHILKWAHKDQFGNISAEARLNDSHVLLTGRVLRSVRIEPFERVCLEGVYKDLPSFNAYDLRVEHVVVRVVARSVNSIEAPSFPLNLIGNIRRQWEKSSNRLGDADAALFRGIVFGDTSGQNPIEARRFRNSGLSHITAVSGENVAFVLIVVFAATGPPRRWGRAFVVITAIAAFVVLTEFQASVLRASMLALFFVIDQVMGRPRLVPERLAICVVVLLCLDPLLVRGTGFCLSVGACSGIVFFKAPITSFFKKSSKITDLISIALAAQVGITAPLVLTLHKFPPVSSLLYVLIEPVVAFLMVLGISWGIVASHIVLAMDIYTAAVAYCLHIVRATAAFGAMWSPAIQVGAWLPIFIAFLSVLIRRRLTSTHNDRTIANISH